VIVAGQQGSVDVNSEGDGLAEAVSGENHVGYYSEGDCENSFDGMERRDWESRLEAWGGERMSRGSAEDAGL
jgi:hypothetical protein